MATLVEACARLVRCSHEGSKVVSFGARWCPACGAFEQAGAGGWFRPTAARSIARALGPAACSAEAAALYHRVRGHGPYRLAAKLLADAYGAALLVELAQAGLLLVDEAGRVAMVDEADETRAPRESSMRLKAALP